MKAKLFNPLITVCLLILFLASCCFGQTKKITDNEIRLISEMMGKYEQKDLFSGVVLIAKEGKVVFNKAYGYSDRENKTKNNLNTVFHLASVNKLFTHVSILKLNDEGSLNINDNIGKYLEGFAPDIAEKVTISHLLTMSGGFANYMNDEEFQNAPGASWSTNELIRLIRKEKLQFEPGSREMYSNSGYVLLGSIIEKVTGKDYFEYVKEVICIPSGMNNTYYFESSPLTNEAFGYHRSKTGEYKKVPYMMTATPCGNMHSIAEDLMRFSIKTLTTTSIISDKAKTLYYSDYDPNYKGDWNALKSNPKRIFGGLGGTNGVSAFLRYFVEDDVCLVILSNFTNISEEVSRNILAIMRDGRYNEI